MRTSITAATLGALTLALAGCGGNASDSANGADGDTAAASTPAAPAADPCSYLSAKEMEAITTDAVVETVAEDNSCTYKTRHNDDLRVTIDPQGGETQMATARRAAGLLEGMGAAVADKGGAGGDVAAMTKRSADAPQVGDEAIWGMAGILYARKGTAYVEVFPPTMHDPATHSGYPLIGKEEKRKIVTTIADRVFTKLKA